MNQMADQFASYLYEGLSPQERSRREYGFKGGPMPWDQENLWHDPAGKAFRRQYTPQFFVSDLHSSPAGQEYADVGGVAQSLGVEGVRQGEAQASDEARQSAASAGLGRGFAQQQQSDIRQRGTEAAADTTMQAELEERSRRYGMASQMAQALIETNKAFYSRYLSEQQRKWGAKAGMLSFFGDVIGAAGAVAGAAIGGPAGAAAGGAAGGAFSGAATGVGGPPTFS